MVEEHWLHAEAVLGDRRHRLANYTLADDAETAGVQIVDRMVKKTELVRFLPFAVNDVLAVTDDRAPES